MLDRLNLFMSRKSRLGFGLLLDFTLWAILAIVFVVPYLQAG